MKELLEYRVFLVNRMGQAAKEFCEACKSLNPATIVDGEWNVHQLAVHVRDLHDLVYRERMLRTMKEENPHFENFDPEEWMKQNYKKEEPLEIVLSDFEASMDELCDILRKVPVESWSRVSHHEIIGDGLPLQLWAERGLAHIEEHLLALKAVGRGV
ncbi:MAG: DinB family protein [Anaerolineales bacterium]